MDARSNSSMPELKIPFTFTTVAAIDPSRPWPTTVNSSPEAHLQVAGQKFAHQGLIRIIFGQEFTLPDEGFQSGNTGFTCRVDARHDGTVSSLVGGN